jgi:hypothetical protein
MTSLGDAEVLSVKHPPGVPIPEFPQRPDDGAHIAAVGFDTTPGTRRVTSGREQSRDIFCHQPTGRDLRNETSELVKKSGPGSSQTKTRSSQGDVLAGPTSDENIDICPSSEVALESLIGHLSNVVVPLDVGPMARQHLTTRRVQFHLEHHVAAQICEALLESADPRKE